MRWRDLVWFGGLISLGFACPAQDAGSSAGASPAGSAASVPAAPASASPRWVSGLDLGAERERLRQERAAAKASQAQEETDCRQRFVVTDCLDRTRRRWQPVLDDLRRQEVALNDAERKQRSAEQLRKLEERNSAQAQVAAARRRDEARSDHEARQGRAAAKASGPQPGGRPRAQGEPEDGSGPGLTREQEAANAQAHARRVQEVQERRERLERRQASRAKPPASALPVPP